MTILLLRGYNNYFNRIKKSETTITAYKEASTSYLEYGDVNFDPKDGILTSLVVGSTNQLEQSDHILDFEKNDTPDYLICYTTETITEEGQTVTVNNIASRWFVLETVKIRSGQYKLALKRDVLIDYGESIMNSPCYVEKGMINDFNNKLLLTSEGFVCNQQKQNEYLLRDKTYSAWLVGYLKKGMEAKNNISYTFPEDTTAIAAEGLTWADCITYYPINGSSVQASKKAMNWNNGASTVKFRTWCRITDETGTYIQNVRLSIGLDGSLKQNTTSGNTDWEGMNSTALDLEFTGAPWYWSKSISYNEARKLGNEIFDHTINWSYVRNFFDTLISATKYNVSQGNNLVNIGDEDIMSYNGSKIIKDGKVYKLSIGQGSQKSYVTYYTGEDNICNDYLSSLYYEFKEYCFLYRNQDNPTRKKVKIEFITQEYEISAFEDPDEETFTINLPASSTRNGCYDAQYDMFCMPIDPAALGLNFEPSHVYVRNGNTSTFRVNTASKIHLAMAQQIATALGAGTDAGEIYDLQLLPFCPMSDTWYNNKVSVIGPSYGKTEPSDVSLNISGLTEHKDYEWIMDHHQENGTDAPRKRGIIFFPDSTNFSRDIHKFSIQNNHIEQKDVWISKPTMKYYGHSDDTGWTGDWPLYYLEWPYAAANDIIGEVETVKPGGNMAYWLGNGYASILGIVGGMGNIVSMTFVVFSKGQYNPNTTYDDIHFDTDDEIAIFADWIIPDTTLERKIQNECDFYRLTSPNYNSFYEFKRSKLFNNTISGFRAICTYKPYTPYIKINPQLDNSLYSIKDYNDNIGLMLGGDFSLPMMSNAMINYELQNRNYQAIFNREVQNLDVNNQIAKEQLDFQGTMGTIMGGFTGSAAGLSAGMKTGNPYVAAGMAVAGGVAGNVLPAVGWAKDQDWLDRQQYEARDFAIDKFNYQIGNIKALPQSMTKSTPLSYNNKVWPILEYFSCTEEEKNVLKDKIKYNGMTVMAIGKLKDYISEGSFVQGKMIRLNKLGDDSHVAQAIYEEVSKGFYNGAIEEPEEVENEGE